jgi:hypothetical protein
VHSTTITNTLIERFSMGLAMSAVYAIRLDSVVVRDLRGNGLYAYADRVSITNTLVDGCAEIGISATGSESLLVVGNVVTHSRGTGMLVSPGQYGAVMNNLVSRCAGEGIWIGGNVSGDMIVRNNSSCLNDGSGFLFESAVDGTLEIAGNIGYGNAAYGIRWGVADVATVRCNDWFANGVGAVQGLPLSSEDFSVNPAFCDTTNGDFHLTAGSPLADWPGCGQVGALGVGCSVVSTRVTRFTAERVQEGIRVAWALGDGSTADQVWLERSDEGDQGPWVRPVTVRTHDGRAEVELDREAIADRAYWYRLLASDGGLTTVITQPIFVEAARVSAFRLVLVGPSPAHGPVRIEFELRERAAIELNVFDILGRRVATPAHGVWPAGRHAVEWSGLTGGSRLPGGVYLVRYRYPGGEDRRRIVRTP